MKTEEKSPNIGINVNKFISTMGENNDFVAKNY